MAEQGKPVGSIKLGISLEGGVEVGNTLDDINKRIKVNESSMKASLKAYDGMGKSTEALAQKQKDLTNVSGDYETKLKVLQKRLQEQENAENRNEQAIANTKKQINDTTAKYNAYSNQLNKTKQELIYAEEGVNDLSDALKENTKEMNNEVKAMKDAGDKAGAFEAKQRGLTKQSDLLKQSIKAQETVVDRLSEEFGENSTQSEKARKSLDSLKNQSKITERQLDSLGKEADTTDDSIKKVGTESEKAGNKLGSFKEKLSFGAVTGLAKRGIDSIVSYLSGMMGEVSSASDSMDKFASTMQFAGFDQKTIDASAKAVKSYADQTVYDLGTVSNTTAQLAANGVKDFVGLTEAAGNLNAVAGGNADTFGSLAMALTQTVGSGKLTTENWNQMADAIPGASGKIQEALKANGAFVGDFREAMANGEITADEFNEAIMQLGYTDAAKEAASSTKTFEGAMGNFQAQLVSSINEIISVFGKEGITDLITAISEKIGEITPKIVGFLKQMVDGFKDLSGWVSENKAMLEPIVASVGAVVGALLLYNGAMTLATGITTGFTAVMGFLTSPITLTVAAIGLLVGAFVLAYQKIEPFKNAVDDLLERVRVFSEKIYNEYIKPAFDEVVRAFTELGNKIKIWWNQNGEQFITALQTFFSMVWALIQPALQMWSGIFGSTFRTIIDLVKISWDTVKGVFSGAFQVIQGLLNIFIGIFTGDWNKVWNGVKDVAQGAWKVITSGFEGFVNGIKRLASGIGDAIASGIGGAVNGVIDAINWVLDVNGHGKM